MHGIVIAYGWILDENTRSTLEGALTQYYGKDKFDDFIEFGEGIIMDDVGSGFSHLALERDEDSVLCRKDSSFITELESGDTERNLEQKVTEILKGDVIVDKFYEKFKSSLPGKPSLCISNLYRD